MATVQEYIETLSDIADKPFKQYCYKTLLLHLDLVDEAQDIEEEEYNLARFFGYSRDENWFSNILKSFYYTPLNIIRLCTLFPLTLLSTLFKNAAPYIFEGQEDEQAEQRWPYIFGKIFCATLFMICLIPMTLIKLLSPENLYTLTESLYNVARLTIYSAFLIVKTIAYFILDTCYDYHKNIEKTGFRKGIALFFGVLRFPIYLIDFVLRSVLAPFGKIEKISIFGYECTDLQHDPQEEWRQASEQIFGRDEKAQKWNSFVGWFGKTLSWSFSIAGWTAISYFTFPIAIQGLCTGLGITFSQTIAGSQTAIAAATVGSTIVVFGIGTSEIMSVEAEKNVKQEEVIPKENESNDIEDTTQHVLEELQSRRIKTGTDYINLYIHGEDKDLNQCRDLLNQTIPEVADNWIKDIQVDFEEQNERTKIYEQTLKDNDTLPGIANCVKTTIQRLFDKHTDELSTLNSHSRQLNQSPATSESTVSDRLLQTYYIELNKLQQREQAILYPSSPEISLT